MTSLETRSALQLTELLQDRATETRDSGLTPDQAIANIEAGLVLSLARTATAFHHADEEWGAALRAAFGRRATDARYSALGQGEPGSELRALYVARYQAYAAWSAARSLPVMPDPVAGMLTVKAVA